jgi:hypothetical protein
MPAYVEGLPVLEEGSHHLHPWVLVNAPRTITLRDGAVGFVLAFWADWFDENVERLDQPGEHPDRHRRRRLQPPRDHRRLGLVQARHRRAPRT